MTYILERLYLGDLDDALSTDSLIEKGISHILTLEKKPLSRDARQRFKYKHVHALDLEDFDLLSHFDECMEFIDVGRRDCCLSSTAEEDTSRPEMRHEKLNEDKGHNDSITCSKQNDVSIAKDCIEDVGITTDSLCEQQHGIGSDETPAPPSHGRCGVLVHCVAGQSRSAAVVVAYIMRTLDMGVDDALALVRRQRPCVGPNYGFMDQLNIYQRMGCVLDLNNTEYRIYRLKILSQQIISSADAADKALGSYLASDSANSVGSSSVYKCKKCRRALFRESSVISHSEGVGEAAFRSQPSALNKSHSSSQSHSSDSAKQCSASLFIEPVDWMKDDILRVNGKVNCPKCSSKLGAFNWAGDRCCCGSWITPAFHIQTSKVDHCRPAAIMASPATLTSRLVTTPLSAHEPSHSATTNTPVVISKNPT